MTIKLTYQQADHLFKLFSECIIPLKPVDPQERLVYLHLLRIFKKLRNKLEAKIKDGYSLALSDEEALAYSIFFYGRHLGTLFHYEQNFINQHLLAINKELL